MKKTAQIMGCDHTKKIMAIKALRNITGLGLKDSKGVIDRLIETGEPQEVKVLSAELTPEQIANIMSEGKVTYCLVYNTIHEKLKEVLIAALDIDRVDVAEHLFKAIKINAEGAK